LKSILFISFDLIRSGELRTSLAIASILAHLKSDQQLSNEYDFEHYSMNQLEYSGDMSSNELIKEFDGFNFEKFNFIALSAYVWNEYLIHDIIQFIRNRGFQGSFILGGYQISYAQKEELSQLYPDVDVFISGYAEESLRKLLSNDENKFPLFLSEQVEFNSLSSPYLSGEIEVPMGSKMLRLETKRGCAFRCSFCAHRDLKSNRVHKFPLEKTFAEIEFIQQRKVKRVNVLDPIFNLGAEANQILTEINRVNTSTTYTLQSRFENIKGNTGDVFIDLCSSGNFHLEFGLQTIHPAETQYIQRNNSIVLIDNAMRQLKEASVSYEVSLIFGLPGQTVDSFKQSIEFLQERGCESIKAYPLMLWRGTELYEQKDTLNLKEEVLGDYHIPLVTSSNTFNRGEWERMNEIAQSLMANDRY
jgi:radical SAM superfamily enzyme YgiQ (UPF0313 family)